MVGALLFVLAGAPAIAALGCLMARGSAYAAALNLTASIVVFAVAVPLTVTSGGGPHHYWGDYIAFDAAGAWVVLCAAIVYLLSSIYAVGYMRLLGEDERLLAFYALFAGFALTILVSPLMNNAALFWIAIELTTLVSTFLVAFERAAESVEAAWKYIVIVSTGISLALLGTVLFYWNGSFVLGPTYNMTWDALRQAAPAMNPALVVLGFSLVLIGYGTKVGLAPMHTWLPDAHSESPAPISAMLSGALLNSAMLGIVRYLAVADAAPSGVLPRVALVVLRAGFHRSFAWAALLMAGLLIVIFIGFLNHFRAMYFERTADAAVDLPTRTPGGWCVAPMWLALVPLLILGLWWPQSFWEFFHQAERFLSSAAP